MIPLLLVIATSLPKVTGLPKVRGLIALTKISLLRVILPLVRVSPFRGIELVPIAPKDMFPDPALRVSA